MDTRYIILNNLSYSLILFNDELKIEFLNLSAQELTGYSETYAKKLTLNQFFYNNKYITGKIENVINTGEGFIDFEFEFVDKGFKTRVVMLEISKIYEAEKFYLLVVMKDMTRFKEMDNNIKNEEKLNDISRFIAEISHEIRNPLAGVKASASYLKKKIGEAVLNTDELSSTYNILPSNFKPLNLKELLRFAEIIVKEINRINILIEDLLSLSKKHKINAGKININKIINEVIELEKNNTDSRSIEFIRQFDPSLPEVYASEDAMKQVFLNVFKNAVFSVKNKGFVKVVTRMDPVRNSPKFIKINFIDSGVGISKKDIKKIFDPFFTTKEKGTGLGLAICRKIIFEHNGFINVDSIKNKGTDVAIYLPVEKKR